MTFFGCSNDKVVDLVLEENHIKSANEKSLFCDDIQPADLGKVVSLFSSSEAIPTSAIESIIQVALLRSETDLVIEYSRKLFKRGCPKEFFKKLGEKHGIKDSRWGDFIDNLDSEELSINHSARQAFYELYYRDQLISSTFSNANINPLYSDIKIRFYELIRKYGFPSEDLIGIEMDDETSIASPVYHIIMLHHYHKGDLLLSNELDSLLKNGFISCDHYEEYKRLEPNALVAEEMNARRSSRPMREAQPTRIFTDNKQPICEDTYLYVPEERNQVILSYDKGIRLAYIDWNMDGLFREKDVDYFAFVYPDETLSCYFKIDEKDTITINGSQIVIDHLTMESQVLSATIQDEANVDITLFTQLDNISLSDGDRFPLVNLTYDTTIVYVYATWCKPCVRKMKSVSESSCEFKANFIPLALESSERSVQLLFEKFDFPFLRLIGDETLKNRYGVESFPLTLLLDKDNYIIKRKSTFDFSDLFKEDSCG